MRRFNGCLGVIVMACAAIACTPVHSTLRPPYVLAGIPYSESQLQSVAADRCRLSGAPAAPPPPNQFTTDGCTLFPNGSLTECCIEHDMAYWCGGPPAARKAADESLRACVEAHGRPLLATFMYVGVRLGGSRWMPLPWRWGYGHPWPHTAPGSAPHAGPGTDAVCSEDAGHGSRERNSIERRAGRLSTAAP